jgi:hypothetical protein
MAGDTKIQKAKRDVEQRRRRTALNTSVFRPGFSSFYLGTFSVMSRLYAYGSRFGFSPSRGSSAVPQTQGKGTKDTLRKDMKNGRERLRKSVDTTGTRGKDLEIIPASALFLGFVSAVFVAVLA